MCISGSEIESVELAWLKIERRKKIQFLATPGSELGNHSQSHLHVSGTKVRVGYDGES